MFLFKNRYGEPRSGWSVAAAMILLIFGQMVGRGLVPDGKEDDIIVKIVVTLVYSLITIGGGILLFKLWYRRSARQMGLAKEGWLLDFAHGFGVGALSIGIVFAGLLFSGQAQVMRIDTAKLLSANMLVNFLSVCLFMFSEELITRGYIMTALKTTRNRWVILFASSVIFALAHLMNPGVTPLSLLNIFIVGFLFAYMFIKSGKLWLSTGFHIAWNFFEGDVLGMHVSGFEQAAAVTTRMGTNELITGGIHGPEGGIFVTAILLLGLLYLHFFVKAPNEPAWTMDNNLPMIR